MNQLMRFEDLREWLLSQIDGSEETRGDDSLISHFINQIDALPSEMGTIPDEERKKVMEAHRLFESIAERSTVEPRGCPTPGACSAVAELADLKQRLLPQANGRAERAEKARQMAVVERDEMLEKLRAATSMPCAPSATAATDRPDWAQQLPGAELYDRDHGYDRTASLNEGRYVCTCGACMSAPIREESDK